MIKIIAINSKYVHTLLSPYYLKENSDYKDIKILQTNINVAISDIVKLALEFEPIAVAFPCYIFNINVCIQVAKQIKNINPDIKIIFGGPEVSFEYEGEYPFADYILIGEGESSFANLAAALSKGEVCDRVIASNAMDITKIKSPYSEDYFNDVEGKIAYFESSRGCPFNCAYCMSGITQLRFFGMERTISDLEKFRGANIRVLKFVDRTFNANIKFAKELMKYIIENSKYYNFGFHFEIAGDLIDSEFISIVKSSPKGTFQFEVGVQSFNEQTLQSVIRKTDINKVISNVSGLIECGKCHVHTDLIAGLPFEGLESFKSGFNKLYDIGSHMLQLGFLKVLKGSRIKEMMTDGYTYNSTPPYEIISTPYLSSADFDELKIVEEAVDKYANCGIFNRTLTHFITGSPYDFYKKLGVLSVGVNELFDKIKVLYDMLITQFDSELVRGVMVLDYLSHNNSRVMPPALKIQYDKSFAKLLRELGIDKKKYYACLININPLTFDKEKCIVYCDYSLGYHLLYKTL